MMVVLWGVLARKNSWCRREGKVETCFLFSLDFSLRKPRFQSPRIAMFLLTSPFNFYLRQQFSWVSVSRDFSIRKNHAFLAVCFTGLCHLCSNHHFLAFSSNLPRCMMWISKILQDSILLVQYMCSVPGRLYTVSFARLSVFVFVFFLLDDSGDL